ncbi:MAG: hypothetical protein J6H18_01890 [Lachnospiraceae bacterium]|nr:hypothetical protein [Lachnospiraceae bacterium]
MHRLGRLQSKARFRQKAPGFPLKSKSVQLQRITSGTSSLRTAGFFPAIGSEWTIDEQDAAFLFGLAGAKYDYTVKRILSPAVKDTKTEDMLQSNYLFSPRDVFGNIVSVHGPECRQLQRQKAVLQFLDEAIPCCQFDISGDDQEWMKKVLLDELRVEAENLGMDLDAFWEMFHEQFLVQLEPDLDKAGAMQADRRIREILFVGAWAERKGVRIREQDYVQMYHLEEYELGEQDKRMLAFCCLEDSLLTQTDSRL